MHFVHLQVHLNSFVYPSVVIFFLKIATENVTARGDQNILAGTEWIVMKRSQLSKTWKIHLIIMERKKC